MVNYEKRKEIGYIRLDQPQQQNLLTLEVALKLRDICSKINQDDGVRVAILSGSGRAFSRGSDFTVAENIPWQQLRELNPDSVASGAMASLDCPTIAAIDGIALGGGLELALSCDIRIASERAEFGFPEVPRGGGTQLLPRIVGRGKALEMIFTGESINAQEAYRVGLVNKVVPPEKLNSEAEKLASLIASRGPVAEKYAKEAVNKGLDLTLGQGLRLEADLSILLLTSEDRAEGLKAFFEDKRTPKFEVK
jgi:enoyl-CoA hydratase